MRIVLFSLLTLLNAADNKAPYNRTPDREVDIHHMKIDVTVDIKSESVYGNVVHTLSPMSTSLKSFALDAEDMTIRRVRHNEKDISFDHSGDKLYITLEDEVGWTDTLNIRIDYTSVPRVGAFFVSPDETYPDKP
ncbi:MAG: hypothetical protein VW667_08275, partial [Candidatus Neomarinimicrobiota bacterium]